MQSFQCRVCSALILCLLLVSDNSFAATYFPAIGSTNRDFAVKAVDLSGRKSSEYSQKTMYCAGIVGTAFIATSCNFPSPLEWLEWAPLYRQALIPVCTVNGRPYFPGMNEMGVTVNILQAFENSSSNRTDATLPLLQGGNGRGERVLLTVQGKVNSINVNNSGDSVDVKCTYPGTAAVPTYYPVQPTSPAPANLYVYTVRFTNISAIKVSVKNQPAFATGALGRQLSMPFTMSVQNKLPTEQLSMSWDVSAPCNSWSPSLQLSNGTVLNIPHANLGRLPDGISTHTAKFTPTALGNFTCTGTLNVSID